MSVDKFGRYASTGKREIIKGMKGDGFLLTDDGDYDIQRKRLKFVNSPVDELDAVNLKSLRENCMSLKGADTFDAENKRIANVSDPLLLTDCVNMNYLFSYTPIQFKKDKSYSFHQFNIKGVAYPQDDGDAVNLIYVKENCLGFDQNKNVDIKGGTLKNIRDPTKGSECATKTYVDANTPSKSKSHWNFYGKRLVRVSDPKDPSDVVTLQYMTDNSMCRVSNAIRQFDGKGNIISNVAGPIQLDDVITKRYLKEVLANLGYAIYSNIHKGRAALTPADQWKSQVLVSTSFDDLFK